MKRISMKKLSTIFLALLLILTVFAGCAAKDEPATKTTEPTKKVEEKTTEPVVETQTEEVMEPVTIKFWHNYDAGAGQIEVLEALIADFEAEFAGIKVEHLYLDWSALKNNVVTGATTGMLPDAFRGDIGFVPLFQSLNVLVEMDTEFSDYAQAAAAVLDAPNSTAAIGDHFQWPGC